MDELVHETYGGQHLPAKRPTSSSLSFLRRINNNKSICQDAEDIYRAVCERKKLNYRGARRKALLVACMMYVSRKHSGVTPFDESTVLQDAGITTRQVMRAIRQLMSMGYRWNNAFNYMRVLETTAARHNHKVKDQPRVPETASYGDCAAHFYINTDATLNETHRIFNIPTKQLRNEIKAISD